MNYGLLATAAAALWIGAAHSDSGQVASGFHAPPGRYTTSWVGNSFGGARGENGFGYWVQDGADEIEVTPDGTVIAGVEWDEAGRCAGLYKDGKVNRVLLKADEGKLGESAWGWGTGNNAIAVWGDRIYIAKGGKKLLRFAWKPAVSLAAGGGRCQRAENEGQCTQMRHLKIPRTDLTVSAICLGTGEFGTRIRDEAAFAMLDAFMEDGGAFVDTAHVYGDWAPDVERSASEKVIGRWIRARGNRESVVLATKGAHPRLESMHIPRMSAAEITQDVRESLDALQTDRIDLYWLHRDDPGRPVDEIVDSLNAEKRAGRIRWFGASNWKPERIRQANDYAAANGLDGFVADQILWNAAVLARQPYGDPTVGFMDAERVAFHAETGMAVLAFQSQAYGLFARMHNGTLEQMNPGFRSFYDEERSRARYERMRRIMDETGLSITQVSLGYLLAQPFVTIPIVGCRNREQLADSLSAGDVRLTPEQVRRIEEP